MVKLAMRMRRVT